MPFTTANDNMTPQGSPDRETMTSLNGIRTIASNNWMQEEFEDTKGASNHITPQGFPDLETLISRNIIQ